MMMLQTVMTKSMGHMQMMWASSMFRVVVVHAGRWKDFGCWCFVIC
jgi:hypothetical protein